MLVPAAIFAEQIRHKFMQYNYTDDMVLYNGCLGYYLPKIAESDDGGLYQYAVVDNNKLIGYFTYQIDWYTSCARCFGLFSFDRNNKMIGVDVLKELRKIINQYQIHRIEWRMVGGNPVEKHYDKFCKRYCGRKFVLTDAIKDRSGKYHNDVIYEIIL